MNIKHTLALLISITTFTIGSTAYACTGICLKSQDQGVVYGRTVEFGIPLDIKLLVIPKASLMDGGDTPNVKPKKWHSKYSVVGINSHGTLAMLDGLNEAGLHVGAFYFPDYAQYEKVSKKDDGNVIHPLLFVNYILMQCSTIKEIREAIKDIKIAGTKVKEWGNIVPPGHWIATDKKGESIVIEPLEGKLVVYNNPLGVMSNAPSFDWHMTNLRNFIYLNPLNVPEITIENLKLAQLGQGSGLGGMPGDFSPPSRFIRATVFSQSAQGVKTAQNAVFETFHILNQFDIPNGAVSSLNNNKKTTEITEATTVADLKNLKYYVHNYHSRRIKMVDLSTIDPKLKKVTQIELPTKESVDDLTPRQ